MKEPTAAEMKVFASKFTKKEWQILCYENKFMLLLMRNLKEADDFAEKVLATYPMSSRRDPVTTNNTQPCTCGDGSDEK